MIRIAAFTVLAAISLQAAPAIDLADGVRYQRIRNLDREHRDIQAALAQPGALIIDLRGAKGDLHVVWLEQNLRQSPADQARFILVNASTSRTLREAIPFPLPGVVTLAPAAARTDAEVQVEADLAVDEAAVEDLDAGGDPRIHFSVTPAKIREDEASLARAHAGEASPSPTPVPPAEKRLADPVLERALQLHQAVKRRTGA